MPASSAARKRCARCATSSPTAERQRNGIQAELAESRAKLAEHEQRRDALQEEVNRLHRVAGDSNAQVGALRTKSEQTAERVSRIGAETEELERDHQSRAGAIAEARARLQEGIEAMAEFETARVELEQEREELRQNLSFKRSQAQTDRDGAQEVAIKVESKRSALQSISAGLERLRHQLEQLQAAARRVDAPAGRRRSAVAGAGDDAGRSAAEARRRSSRSSPPRVRRSKSAEGRMRTLDQRRVDAEAAVDVARAGLEDVRMAAQELKVRRETLLEQFKATQFELATVYQEMRAGSGRCRRGSRTSRKSPARSSASAR